MEEWKEVKLGDVVNILDSKRIPLSSKQRSERRGPYPYYGAQGIIDFIDDYLFDGEYILIAEDGENLRSKKQNIAQIAKGKYWVNNHAHIIETNEFANLKFIYHLLNAIDISGYITGSAQPKLSQANLKAIQLKIPCIEYQQRIASILSSLDDKIELNRRINENLEQQAQALFKSWFIDFEPFADGEFVDSELGMIPKGWRVGTLTDIAVFLNGLAMQKFPPIEGEESLPVLKIKELGQKYCDKSSDRCSNKIDSKYIINNGDIIFSWSGTLLVDFWCGGKCGLNQHLFKVTAKSGYPQWLAYFWTKHHLNRFIRIAQDKAVTMGHIKRGDLDASLVLMPPTDIMNQIGKLIHPIVSSSIERRLESARLATLRDTLLPKLMSGELDKEVVVSKMEITTQHGAMEG